MAVLYKADGAIKEVLPANGKHFTLEELQGFVGGYIQMVETHGKTLVCHEEGKIIGLPFNRNATMVYEHGWRDPIVGDALICPPREIR